MDGDESHWIKRNWPWLALAGTLAITVLVLRLEGRRWFCECADIRVWIADAYSNHTSQHLVDPYSFSHLQHGLVFFWVLTLLFRKWSFPLRFWVALLIEASWEILENSPLIIQRYREATAALGYEGDSVLNAMADIMSCAVGVLLARWLGWRWSLVLFVAIEVSMVIAVRDSLLLNILMLLYPIESIAEWQQAI